MAAPDIPAAHHANHANTGDPVDAQLAQLENRLLLQYAHRGQHTATEVREQFQRAVQRFANARIRSFLPILIDRAVQEKLT